MEKIEAQGQHIVRGGKVTNNVNMSSIWTALIKEAARCESYASDVLLDIDSVREKLEAENPVDFTYYFGFRDNGVDHEQFIRNRKSDEYRIIMALNVRFVPYGDNGYEKCSFVYASLQKVDRLPDEAENPA